MSQTKLHWTPLAVITLFVGLVDSALVLVIPKTVGGIQVALIVFVFLFTFFFFGTFILFLWKKPFLLYGPSEWGETPKLQDFVQTVSGSSPKQSDTEGEKITETAQVVIETQEQNEQQEEQEEFNWWEPYVNEKYAEAREVMKLAIDNAKNQDQLVFLRTMSASALSNIDLYSSVVEYQKVIDEYPDEIFPYRSFAWAYERTAQYTKAIEILDMGISNVAKDDKITLKLDRLDLLAKKGEAKDLAEIKTLAIDIAESSKEPKQIAKAYRVLGSFFTEQKLLDKAKKAFILAFNSARADKQNLEEIANHFRDTNDYKTELYFRTLIVDLKPNDEAGLVLLGNCYYILNQLDLAYQKYKKAGETSDKASAWVFGNMGNLYNRVGLHTLGIVSLEQALKITPDDTYAHERIAGAIASSKKELEESKNIINSVKKEIVETNLTLDDVDQAINQ